MSLINLLPDLVCSIRMIKRNNFSEKTQQAVTERKKRKKMNPSVSKLISD